MRPSDARACRPRRSSCPDVTATPKRLSEYGALTVARTFPPAVQVPTGEIETVMPGTLAEFVAANVPSLWACASEGASPDEGGAPESAAARAPSRAASERSM